jgi:hypothetical protein
VDPIESHPESEFRVLPVSPEKFTGRLKNTAFGGLTGAVVCVVLRWPLPKSRQRPLPQGGGFRRVEGTVEWSNSAKRVKPAGWC